MKMMTALALVLASAPAAYAASPTPNESFIQQIGTQNSATIKQKNGQLTAGDVGTNQRRALLSNPVGELASLIGPGSPGYVVFSRGQEAEVEMTGELPAGSAAQIERAVSTGKRVRMALPKRPPWSRTPVPRTTRHPVASPR